MEFAIRFICDEYEKKSIVKIERKTFLLKDLDEIKKIIKGKFGIDAKHETIRDYIPEVEHKTFKVVLNIEQAKYINEKTKYLEKSNTIKVKCNPTSFNKFYVEKWHRDQTGLDDDIFYCEYRFDDLKMLEEWERNNFPLYWHTIN